MAEYSVPSTMRRLVAVKLGTKFREVTKIVEADVPSPGPKEVLIKNRYLGINASDINLTLGRYFTVPDPPFTVGFEALGEIVKVGTDVQMKVGQVVAYITYGCFEEYTVMSEAMIAPVPSCCPEYLTLLISGLTASMALDKEGDLKPGQKVLVTAAAGGTGQYAVQLAKLAGCYVIGTCSSEDKTKFLKSLGCDRVINYRTEDVNQVLSQEYPDGIDVVYESVGNEMLDATLLNIAERGRIIVIGMVANYHKEGRSKSSRGVMGIDDEHKVSIPMTCLSKNASMRGFYLPSYLQEIPSYFKNLIQLYTEGKLKVLVDRGERLTNGPFVGLEMVADAVEYLYSKQSLGKIIVEMPEKGKSQS